MFAKLAIAILVATAIGAGLLGLRQQRVQTVNRMAMLHSQMNRTRQSMWDTQVRIAEFANPARLREAMARAGVAVEPLFSPVPVPGPGRNSSGVAQRRGTESQAALPSVAVSPAHARD